MQIMEEAPTGDEEGMGWTPVRSRKEGSGGGRFDQGFENFRDGWSRAPGGPMRFGRGRWSGGGRGEGHGPVQRKNRRRGRSTMMVGGAKSHGLVTGGEK